MPLKKIIKEIKESPESSLCVFDLDSTLFNVSPRSEHIVKLFAKDPSIIKLFPEESKALEKIKVLPSDWGIKQAIARHKVKATIDFFDQLRKFWETHFFSNNMLSLDQPYPGSVEFINHICKLGARVVYLTGRDQVRMGEGTIESLKKYNLPLDEYHQLYLKPKAGMSDSLFKKDIFSELVLQHRKIWFFENEPVNINLIKKHFEQVQIVFIDSVHSGREAVEENVITIPMKFDF